MEIDEKREHEDKMIVFSVDIPERTAGRFDEIAKNNFRSRAAHLRWIIEQHVYYDSKHVPF